MKFHGTSDIGCVRQENEDAFIAQTMQDKGNLLCAAIDGIGGNEGGKVAAEVARKALVRHIEEFYVDDFAACLQQAVVDANNEVVRYQSVMPRYREMGCVLSIGILDSQNKCLYYANVGDARIYVMRGNDLKLLTEDDAQGRRVTNYIGKRTFMYNEQIINVKKEQFQSGDTLLFCTDGLWKMVDEREVATVIAQRLSPEEMCHQLIQRANENGGTDNITVVVVKV